MHSVKVMVMCVMRGSIRCKFWNGIYTGAFFSLSFFFVRVFALSHVTMESFVMF